MLTPEREKEIRQRIDAIKHYAKTSQLMGSYEETPGPDMEEMLAEIDSLREKLKSAEPLLEERFVLIQFIESRGLLFEAYEALSKIRGDK